MEEYVYGHYYDYDDAAAGTYSFPSTQYSDPTRIFDSGINEIEDDDFGNVNYINAKQYQQTLYKEQEIQEYKDDFETAAAALDVTLNNGLNTIGEVGLSVLGTIYTLFGTKFDEEDDGYDRQPDFAVVPTPQAETLQKGNLLRSLTVTPSTVGYNPNTAGYNHNMYTPATSRPAAFTSTTISPYSYHNFGSNSAPVPIASTTVQVHTFIHVSKVRSSGEKYAKYLQAIGKTTRVMKTVFV